MPKSVLVPGYREAGIVAGNLAHRRLDVSATNLARPVCEMLADPNRKRVEKPAGLATDLGAQGVSRWRRLFIAGVFLTTTWTLSATQSLTLTWNPSPDPRAVGYVLVYGNNSGIYNQSTNVGNVVEATVNGLVEGRTYYFAVYAYAANALQSDLSNEVCYQVPSAGGVVNRLVFYNNSAWDNYEPAANANDDAAIATDKIALLPGAKASFTNYTSYSAGLNGVMIDIAGLGTTVTLADFVFRVGNDSSPSAWPSAPAPSALTVRRGAGTSGSDRVTVTWPDNAIQGKWLQVTVRATANTGLASPDVFYIGESGNSPLDAAVTSADALFVLSNVNPVAGPVTSPVDFNRDRKVTSADALIALNNVAVGPSALQLITPATSNTGMQQAAAAGSVLQLSGIDSAAVSEPSTGSSPEWTAQILGLSRPGDGWTVARFHYPGPTPVRVWQSTTLHADDWQELPADWIAAQGENLYEVRIPDDQAGAHSFFRFSSQASSPLTRH
jgi:hypothetical protein